MKPETLALFVFLLLLITSCSNKEEFDVSKEYSPISLMYKEKPFLTPGQKLEDLDAELSYRLDPMSHENGNFKHKKDFLSTDDYFTVQLDIGVIGGIVFFHSDNSNNRITGISGNWTFSTDKDSLSLQVAFDQFTHRLFPILNEKLDSKRSWNLEIDKINYTETFKLIKPEEEYGFWKFYYKAHPK
ncbi:hypothetical protein [Brumimicrobium oceani]|nr:hypothetical protein [Brumimicrobium oceani]